MTTATIDLMTTVALTRTSPRGSALPAYTTNDGAILIARDMDGSWAVGPLGGRQFVNGLPDLEACIDFILGARAMLAPAEPTNYCSDCEAPTNAPGLCRHCTYCEAGADCAAADCAHRS
jgi:hypothetical protein